jgi:hypothetical protein
MEPHKEPHRHDPKKRDTPLSEHSMSGAIRVHLEGFQPGSPELANALASLCLTIHSRKLAILSPRTRELVEELDLFEWSESYPKTIIQRGFPFYRTDQSRHETLNRLEEDYKKVKQCQAQGVELDKRLWPHDLHPNTPWNYHFALANISRDLDDGLQELRKRAGRGITVPEGRIRPTEFGELVIRQLVGKPLDLGGQVLRLVMRAEELTGKGTRRRVVEHIGHLWEVSQSTQPNKELRVKAFDRHLRKLGVALLENSLPFDSEMLRDRGLVIEAESHVDTYLAGTSGRLGRSRHAKAYKWLQEEGQHCPLPYTSWQPTAEQECFTESFKIVTRARNQSYHCFRRLRMENRAIGAQQSLFREFANEAFEDVRMIRGDNLDMPPGRGTLLSGARLEKLFFNLGGKGDILAAYERSEDSWFADSLYLLENANIIVLRGWIGITGDGPKFSVQLHERLEPERYYYIVDNDHFSGSYGYAYGIPSSVIARKILPAVYGLDDSPEKAYDVGKTGSSIPALIQATLDAGKVPLKLGGMSPLFGGMCNAIPAGVSPVFAWENKDQTTIWRDADRHVHWSWLVWSFRDDRSAVNRAVQPLQVADQAVREFAVSGQKLFDIFHDRYAAWKNDQTPGEKRAPRMLVRAYDIYREHMAKGDAGKNDETVYVGITNRNNPTFNPTPILNCHTLELRSGATTIHLPKKTDGTENIEGLVWRKYVRPLIETVGLDGPSTEGVYELVLMGENDIQRR